MRVEARDDDGQDHQLAAVFEERDAEDGRRWWVAMLPYRSDPNSGLGLPEHWQESAGETDNPANLPPFVAELAAPPPGARAAQILSAADVWQPDIKFAFGEVAAGDPVPTDPRQMIEFAAGLGAWNDLLTGALQGTIVVRIAHRSWEI